MLLFTKISHCVVGELVFELLLNVYLTKFNGETQEAPKGMG